MKSIKGLIPGAFFFVSIFITALFLNSFLKQAPNYFSALLIAGSAVVLFYILSKWDKITPPSPNENNPADPQALEKAYLKLAEANTNLLGKEESLRKFSHIIEQSPTSIVITDIKGNIEYVNPRFCDVTGYTYEEAIGQNPRILKSGEIPPEGYKELWKTITSGETWRGEFHNKKKDGTLYWEFAHIAPVKDQVGKVTHYIAVKENITTTICSCRTLRTLWTLRTCASRCSFRTGCTLRSLRTCASRCSFSTCRSLWTRSTCASCISFRTLRSLRSLWTR